MKKTLTFILAAILLATSALALTGCGSQLTQDSKRIQGTWKTEDGTRQLVITATQIKMPANVSINYKLAASNKITLSAGTQTEDASYTFSKDGKTLTITETIPQGATTATAQPTTVKQVLKKTSDKTDSTPQTLSPTNK